MEQLTKEGYIRLIQTMEKQWINVQAEISDLEGKLAAFKEWATIQENNRRIKIYEVSHAGIKLDQKDFLMEL